MPIFNLSDLSRDKMICPPDLRRVELVDVGGIGLYCELRQSSPGVGTYYLRYRNATGKTCHQKIGSTDVISVVEARKEAKRLKAEITLGADPAEQRKAKRAIPLYSEFFEKQYLPYVLLRKRSAARDKGLYESRVKPAIGHLRLDQVSRSRIQALHSAVLSEGLAPATANHHVRLIRYSLNLAVDWGLLEKNPASRIPLFREDNIVNNVPNDDELERLLTVLRNDRNRTVCQIALVLLNTAARLSEILRLRWSDCDLDKRVITIRASNSKSMRQRKVPINSTTLEVLQNLPSRGVHDYVFANKRTGEPYKFIRHAWINIRNRAGLPKLRIHDLRHAACSYMSASGIELWTIATIAGHSDPKITTRYSHVPPSALANAMEMVSKKQRGESSPSEMVTADQPKVAEAG